MAGQRRGRSLQAHVGGAGTESPREPLDADVSVAQLDFSGPVTVTQEPFILPGPDGRVTFGAFDADAHGHYDGNIQTRGSGPDVYLTDWKNPIWSLEFRFKSPRAGRWDVQAEVAAPDPTSLSIEADKKSVVAKVPATGSGLTWKIIDLGSIELPAGETGFTLKGVKENWRSLSIRHVWLMPAKP